MTDASNGARTIEDNVHLWSSAPSTKKFNVSNLPLFPSIPLTNLIVVISISSSSKWCDVLIDLVIVELQWLDRVGNLTRFSSLEKLAYLQKFQKL